MISAKRIRMLTSRNVKEILRDPVGLIFLYALPLVMLVLFYYLFSSQTDQFRMEYLAPSMIAFSHAFLTLFLGILIASDRASSFIVRLYTTRIRPSEFILSYAFAMLPVGLTQTALLLSVAAGIDRTFFTARLLLGLSASIATELLFIALGLLFGTLCGERAVGGIASVVVTGQSLLSGMWFPTEGLSGNFIAVLNALPFRSASLLMQNVISGSGGYEAIIKPLSILLAYAFGIAAAAILFYRKRMKQ